MTNNLTRTAAGVLAAGMIATAGAGAALAADPTDTMIYIAGELTVQYDLPAGLILAVCETESDFDPDCRTGSCVGLMQLHSAYAAAFARAAGLETYSLTDPEDNMRIGAHLLADYRDRYEGDIHMWLMAYNLGEYGALAKRREGVETTGYSRKVVGRMEKWAVVGVPETDGRALPAPTEDAGDPVGATIGRPESLRAVVTGVWQRVKEVLFR